MEELEGISGGFWCSHSKTSFIGNDGIGGSLDPIPI